MRIVVVKPHQHINSYTACIHRLLQDMGHRNGYTVTFTAGITDAAAVTDQSITFITLPKTSFINKLLQQQRLTNFIKDNNIDLLIQNAGAVIKQKSVPQLLIADDIEQLPPIEKVSYAKIFLLTYSQFAKQGITDKGFTNTIHVVPFFSEASFQPITWSQQQQVKIDYTEGSEYFFVPQSFNQMEDILYLMKAFSGFKKWQHSSMKLVLGGKLYVPSGDWEEKLSTYRYREDVMVYNHLPEEENGRLLAGAYACILLPKKDNEVMPLLHSLQCHVPVISTDTATAKAYAANALLSITNNSHEALTQAMILMYKDENMRSRLIDNCAMQAAAYSKENALQALQNIIL